MTDARDQLHVDDPYYSSRTIFIDTTGFSSTNFHLTTTDKLTLFTNGHNAAQQFLKTWDYQQWLAANAPRAPRAPFDAAKAATATTTPTPATDTPAPRPAERENPG